MSCALWHGTGATTSSLHRIPLFPDSLKSGTLPTFPTRMFSSQSVLITFMHEGARFFKVIGGGGGWGTQSESKLFVRPCLKLTIHDIGIWGWLHRILSTCSWFWIRVTSRCIGCFLCVGHWVKCSPVLPYLLLLWSLGWSFCHPHFAGKETKASQLSKSLSLSKGESSFLFLPTMHKLELLVCRVPPKRTP